MSVHYVYIDEKKPCFDGASRTMYIKDVNIVKYSGSQSVCSCMQDTMASSQLYNGDVKGSTRQLWNIYEFKVISFKVFQSCCSVGKLEGHWFLHVMSRNRSLIRNSEVVCVLVHFGGIGTPSIPPQVTITLSKGQRIFSFHSLSSVCTLLHTKRSRKTPNILNKTYVCLGLR